MFLSYTDQPYWSALLGFRVIEQEESIPAPQHVLPRKGVRRTADPEPILFVLPQYQETMLLNRSLLTQPHLTQSHLIQPHLWL